MEQRRAALPQKRKAARVRVPQLLRHKCELVSAGCARVAGGRFVLQACACSSKTVTPPPAYCSMQGPNSCSPSLPPYKQLTYPRLAPTTAPSRPQQTRARTWEGVSSDLAESQVRSDGLYVAPLERRVSGPVLTLLSEPLEQRRRAQRLHVLRCCAGCCVGTVWMEGEQSRGVVHSID